MPPSPASLTRMGKGEGDGMKAHNRAAACLSLVFVLLSASSTAPAADTGFVRVTAVIRASTECTVSTGNPDLVFGPAGEGSPDGASRNTSMTYRCAGNAGGLRFKVFDDGGLHASDGNVRRLTSDAEPGRYIPYTFEVSRASAPAPGGESHTLHISAALLAGGRGDFHPGDYGDIVTLTIAP